MDGQLVQHARLGPAEAGADGLVAADASGIGMLHPSAAGRNTRQTAELSCSKAMVGRVIGKNGETIKALQTYTGALIQIDQSTDPTRVTVSGNLQSLSLAVSMISDICKGTFKGFALLRQMTQQQRSIAAYGVAGAVPQPRPVYAPGYGLIPPSQLYGAGEEQRLIAGPGGTLAYQQPRRDALPMQGLTYQYVPAQPAGAVAGVTPSQVILGLPAMPGRAIPLSQGHQQMATVLGPGPVQQLAVQQVYSTVPVGNSGFATQLAYYPSQDYGATSEPTLIYQPVDASGTVSFPQQPGAGTVQHGGAKLLSAAAGGPKPGGPGSGWVGKVDGAHTMGSAAMNELLGTSGGQGVGGGPGGLQAPGGSSSSNQQLLQVVDPEGRVSYLYQDA